MSGRTVAAAVRLVNGQIVPQRVLFVVSTAKPVQAQLTLVLVVLFPVLATSYSCILIISAIRHAHLTSMGIQVVSNVNPVMVLVMVV